MKIQVENNCSKQQKYAVIFLQQATENGKIFLKKLSIQIENIENKSTFVLVKYSMSKLRKHMMHTFALSCKKQVCRGLRAGETGC
ncbi:MAG TPA: hypothetical protein VGC22_08365 [Chitinophaga sp.]